jgi:hypothetical protein
MVAAFGLVFFGFYLIGILLVSILVALFPLAAVFFVEGRKGKSVKDATKKAFPIVISVFTFSVGFICLATFIYLLNTPFYIP